MRDKPAFTFARAIGTAQGVQAETGRIYSFCYSERLENPATIKAGEARARGRHWSRGSTVGLGPHRIIPPNVLIGFTCAKKYGGILTDIASHQWTNFCIFTGSTQARVVASTVANYKYPSTPGSKTLAKCCCERSSVQLIYSRDWYTPAGSARVGRRALNDFGNGKVYSTAHVWNWQDAGAAVICFWLPKSHAGTLIAAALELPYGRSSFKTLSIEPIPPSARAHLSSRRSSRLKRRRGRPPWALVTGRWKIALRRVGAGIGNRTLKHTRRSPNS